jgi:relaxase-like protein
VIIKGTSCAGARRLAVHLTRTDTNERAEVKEIRGVVAQDLSGALREMEGVASGARTNKPFYHGSINTRADERLTDEQRTYAIDKLEASLGLTGQARVVVVHEKEGREHCHIVWSRIDLDRMAAISDSHNYRKHEQVARALEKEFGHERVQGAHIERDGKERPDRTPSHSEMLQADRTGVSPAAARALMTDLWRETDSGKSFQEALETKWWVLARGDRRDFVAIDSEGGLHSVARRIEGAKAADVRQRFADIDPASLPSVAEAKQMQRESQAERERQAEQDRTDVRPAAARALMTQLWRETDSGKTFQAALETKWWVLARGDQRGLVAIDSEGGVHSVARRIEGAKAADVQQRFADLDPKSLPSVAEAKQTQRDRQAERERQSEQDRTPVRPAAARAMMTEVWRETDSGKTFQAALETKWWVLARGDKREFVAIDSQGGVHSVARRIEGAKAADVRQRFADLDPKSLPTVAAAKKLQHARQGERARQAGARAIEQARPKADHAPVAAGPKRRIPGVGRAKGTAVKVADSVFSALMGEKPSPPKKPDPSRQAQDTTPSQRRQELMRQLSREIPQGMEQDAEIELDQGRQRTRGY